MKVWTYNIMKNTWYWKEKILKYSEPPAKMVSLIKLEKICKFSQPKVRAFAHQTKTKDMRYLAF